MSAQPSATPRTLNVAGTEVARIGLGTNRLTSTQETHAFLREAVEAGIGLIDTAHVYTGGDSERAIGEALSPVPDSVVVATKGGYSGSGSPEAIRAQIEQSLESLRTDAIDLYYLHRVDPETPLEESLGAIAEYREAGKINEVGVSAVDVGQIEAARKVVPIAAVQNHYNLTERGSDDVVDYCEENGIVFVPYYPLKGDEPPALGEIAESHGASRAQIALAWLLRRSPVVLPIPGTLSIEHVHEDLGALDIELTDDEFDALG
ncbi:MAG: pyridoxine 4-dehydrogenase [Solirubrobacterales bacterium]|jgi:aryl-alcohol dehydrogenase-like predicted oxidoreductase|nr:pyridoxine 4-dehydrogenase [Solirubrobacterales bacterium]